MERKVQATVVKEVLKEQGQTGHDMLNMVDGVKLIGNDS